MTRQVPGPGTRAPSDRKQRAAPAQSSAIRDFPPPNTLRGMVPPNSFAADREGAGAQGNRRRGAGASAGVMAPGRNRAGQLLRILLFAALALIVVFAAIAVLGIQP